MRYSTMKTLLSLCLTCLLTTPAIAQIVQPEWQSQYAIGKNKLAPHTYIWPYANAETAGECNYEQ